MRLLILGTGGMANSCDQFRRHRRGHHCWRRRCRSGAAGGLLRRARIERQFSLEEALAWGEFDAVANVTPDASIIRPRCSDRGGQARLLRKAAGDRCRKAMEMTEAIGEAGLVSMVNLTYRNSPRCRRGARSCSARSARSDTSRRRICRAGWSPRPGATGRPRASSCGGFREARLERRAGRYRHPHRRFRLLWRGARHRACLRPPQDLRQGAG